VNTDPGVVFTTFKFFIIEFFKKARPSNYYF